MKPVSEEARQLLAAGQRDRIAFRVLRRDAESPVEIILFHAQQALEKLIKTALVIEGVVFRRTHDLLELNDRALQAGIVLPVSSDLLARIGPYAVEFRDLGVIAPMVSVEEAENAVDALWVWLEKQVDITLLERVPEPFPSVPPAAETCSMAPESPTIPAPKTSELGRKLLAIRQRAIAQGLDSVDEILAEVRQGRAEAGDDQNLR